MSQYIEFLICFKKGNKSELADIFIFLFINVTSTIYLHVNYFADRKNVHKAAFSCMPVKFPQQIKTRSTMILTWNSPM